MHVRRRLVERVGDLADHVGREPAVLGLREPQRRQHRALASRPGTSRARPGSRRTGRASPVDLAHHGVERADDRDHVGDQRVGHARRGRLQRDERRRAELDAPRPRAAVGADVAAELAARRLDREVDLALGHAEALGDDLEVVDQRLHRRVQLVARRQHDLAVVGDPRLALHVLEPVEALLDDAHRLAHLLHVHAVARVDVALGEHRHAEVDLVVGEVRLDLAHVPVDARRAQHRPGLAERDRVVGRQQPEPLGALEPDLVARQERLVVVDRLRHPVAELARLGVEAARDVLGEAADLEVARVHAVARDELEEVEDLLALAERVPEHRDRAELERRGAEPDEMRVDAVQLAAAACASRSPSAGSRGRAASRPRRRRRTRCSGTRRSRCAART